MSKYSILLVGLVVLSGCKSCSWPLNPGLDAGEGEPVVDSGSDEVDATVEVDAGEAVILPAPEGIDAGLELPPSE